MGVCLSKTYVVNYVISSSPSWQDMTWHTGRTWYGKLAGHDMASWQDMVWQAGRTWYGKLARHGMASWHDLVWQARLWWFPGVILPVDSSYICIVSFLLHRFGQLTMKRFILCTLKNLLNFIFCS